MNRVNLALKWGKYDKKNIRKNGNGNQHFGLRAKEVRKINKWLSSSSGSNIKVYTLDLGSTLGNSNSVSHFWIVKTLNGLILAFYMINGPMIMKSISSKSQPRMG